MPRAKQRTPELRDRVLGVAVTALNEHGIAGFTTRRVAELAGTSVPAVYELFDDKAGLVRQVFFEGFRLLGRELAMVPATDDRLADVEALAPVFRRFCLRSPALAQVMFSRPFADFDPGPEEEAAAASVRGVFTGRIERCVDAGLLVGDPTDIAHVLLALVQGLAVQEGGRWLGNSRSSVNRRWTLGVQTLLRGFRP
ncbi:MAG: transcriptional regulator [Mycobacterium sp.]|nr:transcriptional regulator [Mycobacterium sp.]